MAGAVNSTLKEDLSFNNSEPPAMHSSQAEVCLGTRKGIKAGFGQRQNPQPS
jgi:hypothetical protein